MKKLAIKTWVFSMLLGFAFTANATIEEPFSLYMSKSSEAKKLIMRFDNMMAEVVKAQIVSKEGIIVHQERINTRAQKVRKYDLGQLEPGAYTFVIDDLMKVEKVQFSVESDEVIFSNEPTQVTFKPTVWVNNDKTVDFNLLSLGNDAKIVIMRDGVDYLVERYNDQSTVSQRYNLSKLEAGQYTIDDDIATIVDANGASIYLQLAFEWPVKITCINTLFSWGPKIF